MQSLGETLVLQAGRGSVVDLSPSGQHLGDALLTLNEALVLAIFRDRTRTVGDAVNQAKLYYAANTLAWHDVIDTSILFGDPAVRLRVPVTQPAAPTVAITAGSGEVTLRWPHALDSAQYEVWRSTSPGFDPDAGEGALLSTIDVGFRGAGAGYEFTDTGSEPLPAATVLGDVNTNYFWVIRSRNGDGTSATAGAANRVGAFNYALSPGN
jgi:hypothetical protein